MVTFRKFQTAFRELKLGKAPVIVHASLSSFGEVRGGAETVVGALLAGFESVIVPTFTYRTMITPETGPPDNGITYGRDKDANLLAEFYSPQMPADPLMGVVAETLRKHPRAKRSIHPVYSFSGVNAATFLATQTLQEPYAPIEAVTQSGGWVLLLGVDHAVNTSIHYAEQVAGRRQFIRWALTPQGIVECPHWPNCSHGFNKISSKISASVRITYLGNARVQAIPLQTLVIRVKEMIAADPTALLCNQPDCERCNASSPKG